MDKKLGQSVADGITLKDGRDLDKLLMDLLEEVHYDVEVIYEDGTLCVDGKAINNSKLAKQAAKKLKRAAAILKFYERNDD